MADDVCTIHPTLTAPDQGYRVQVVAAAGGSMTRDAEGTALRRPGRAGADITTINTVLVPARPGLGGRPASA